MRAFRACPRCHCEVSWSQVRLRNGNLGEQPTCERHGGLAGWVVVTRQGPVAAASATEILESKLVTEVMAMLAPPAPAPKYETERFGRLVIIGPGLTAGTALCRCDRGREVTRSRWCMRKGIQRSCGCLMREVAAANQRAFHQRRRMQAA